MAKGDIVKYQFHKGVSGNPNGRPRKLVTQFSDLGYKASEINDILMVLLAMTVEELRHVYESPDSTILEKTVARALKKDLDKGNLHNLETILSRAFGRSRETQDAKKDLNMKAFKVTISNR